MDLPELPDFEDIDFGDEDEESTPAKKVNKQEPKERIVERSSKASRRREAARRAALRKTVAGSDDREIKNTGAKAGKPTPSASRNPSEGSRPPAKARPHQDARPQNSSPTSKTRAPDRHLRDDSEDDFFESPKSRRTTSRSHKKEVYEEDEYIEDEYEDVDGYGDRHYGDYTGNDDEYEDDEYEEEERDTSKDTLYHEYLGNGWYRDKKNGAKFKKLDNFIDKETYKSMKKANNDAARSLMQRKFDEKLMNEDPETADFKIDDLESTADIFMKHLRVPPTLSERAKLEAERKNAEAVKEESYQEFLNNVKDEQEKRMQQARENGAKGGKKKAANRARREGGL